MFHSGHNTVSFGNEMFMNYGDTDTLEVITLNSKNDQQTVTNLLGH